MTTSLLRSLAGGFLLTGMFTSAAPPGPRRSSIQPLARAMSSTTITGPEWPDPYRWLEDPDSPESRAWIEAQNRLTAAYLAEIPARRAIRERLTKLWNYPKYGTPFRKGRRYFFFKNDGLQNQSVLYKAGVAHGGPGNAARPEPLCPKTARLALSTLAVSDDGRLLAYGTSASGSDWEEFRVRTSRGARPDRPSQVDQVLRRPRGARTAPVSSIAGIRSPRTRPSPT